jgi:hypothetical protein
VTDDASSPVITAANDIRIRIPSGFNMSWDTSDTTAVITGSAAGKVSTTVSYEDGGKTLVINVTSNFSANDYITVSGLSFANFTQAAYTEYLELKLSSGGASIAESDKWIAIGGRPTAGSMLVYGEGNVITPRYRTWDGTAFSLEGSAPNTDDTISWVVLKASPVANEMILGVYASATKTLFVLTWNGAAWTSNWSTVMDLDASYRGFDIAYERNSGDAVVVFTDLATHTLKYRKRVGGVWDTSNQTITTLDDEANWVRAESRPTNDDIFVAAQSNAKSVYAMRWNGASNTWGDQVLASSQVANQATESIDIAFERSTGHAFLIWGDGAKNLKYREFTTIWQAEATAYVLPDAVKWLAADYDPRSTSSEIAVAMVLGNTTFEFAAWNGTSWVTRPAAITTKNNDQRGIDVQFNSGAGQAMYIFNQSAKSRQLAWRTWSAAGGFGAVTVAAGATSADINFMRLEANPRGNEMMAVYVDNNKDLFHRYWNGSSWTTLDTTLEAEISDQDKNEAFMFAWKSTSPPTAVDLISFTATGRGGVVVNWETAQEAANKGFNLYRAEAAGGAYVKLNSGLIPAASISGEGRSYRFTDINLIRGRLYYYKLEDVDVSGAVSVHGPVCVDWDADGLSDDWEIAHGLNPAVNDAHLDSDGDGVPNWLEYQRGTDPFNPDTDGDGIPDGAEKKSPGYSGGSGSVDLGESVQVISSDSTGVTLELLTRSFDTTPVQVGGQAFERLRVPAYVHGFTQEIGNPQLPLKGILIDVPEGKTAVLRVLSVERRVMPSYRVYPVPEHRVGDKSQLEEVFVWDEPAYRADAFVPVAAAELSTAYVYRGQTKQRLIFHPLQFNPARGDLIHAERIRVRVEFYPASGVEKFDSAQGAGNQMAASEGEIHPAAAAAQGWSIPAGAAYKVSTEGEGIYRITREWLTAQGIAASDIDAIDLSRVQLFHLGVEQALHVVDANSNNRLDPGDSITLYAAAVPAAYAKYAKYNVYWLIDAGSVSPLRMNIIDGAPAGAPLAVAYPSTVHHELDQGYLQNSPGPDGMDRWLFPAVALGPGFAGGGTAKSFTLTLAGGWREPGSLRCACTAPTPWSMRQRSH